MSFDLKTKVPGQSGRTLAETVERMRVNGMVRLFTKGDDLTEDVTLFERAIRRGEVPSNGQVLAAYYVAAINALDDAYYADGSEMTTRSYAARKAGITKVVYRSGQ